MLFQFSCVWIIEFQGIWIFPWSSDQFIIMFHCSNIFEGFSVSEIFVESSILCQVSEEFIFPMNSYGLLHFIKWIIKKFKSLSVLFEMYTFVLMNYCFEMIYMLFHMMCQRFIKYPTIWSIMLECKKKKKKTTHTTSHMDVHSGPIEWLRVCTWQSQKFFKSLLPVIPTQKNIWECLNIVQVYISSIFLRGDLW